MVATGEASWLKDGVEAIERLAQKGISVTPSILALPAEKPGTYAIVTPGAPGAKLGDVLDIRIAKPLWHNEQLATPDNLVSFIETHGRPTGPAGDEVEGVVYIGTERIVYCYNFEDRRDRATVPLTLSKPWRWLAAADAGTMPPMTQRDIIRLLRITFGGSLPGGSNLVGTLRRLKFTNNGAAEADIQHGNHSLGKQILNQVTGVDALPEEFSLNVQVFENFPLTVQIQVALEIQPDVQKFEVIPSPNQLQRAMETTLEAIRSKFAASDVPAYLGQVRGGNPE